MATDFTYGNKTITTTGGVRPNTKNTPLDVRTRVNIKDDIKTIPNPFIGMHVLVLQDESRNNEMAENILKSMNFKMPVETVKKKFFPDEETLQACVEAGKEYAKLVK